MSQIHAVTQKRETLVAIFLFILVILGNAVIFTIVPYLATSDMGQLFQGQTAVLKLAGFGEGELPAVQGVHPFQIMLFLVGVALVCMLPWAARQGAAGLKTTQWKLYGVRALLEYGGFVLTFFSLGYIGDVFTLPMHTALNFASPLIATVAAIVILREKSYSHTWIALFIGFVGLLLITRPGIMPASAGVLFVLAAATAFSLCGIVIKLLTRTESAHSIAFYMLLLTTILALPAGMYYWQTPSTEGWVWLIVIGLIAYAQQILVGKAIAKVPYMLLIPLNFTQLIFVTLLNYAVFGKLIDGYTLLGASVVFIGTFYNAQRSRTVATREVIQASVV
jgi:drug/metabolite transporter (DMT)-like permease